MQTGEPSRTAWAAAFHRAAHQVLDGGRIFADPLAVRILKEDEAGVARQLEDRGSDRRMRIFIALRTRFAEDSLAAAFERGVRQLVILGAGFDTYAYRGTLRCGLRIWEVDHPATQAWKRQRLEEVGIAVPENLTFAAVDFERDTLADGLASAGFDGRETSFFTWLGVVPYLTEDAIQSTLGFIGGLPGGAQVVFDYADPPESLAAELRAAHDLRAARVAGLGEAFRSFLDAATMRAKLVELGFRDIEDLGPPQIAARYFPKRVASMPERGGHLVRAVSNRSVPDLPDST
ncbi:MAG TPA: SAM-dependent methyltransferase [Bryobacteraceae bacterium]|nr:SAM-dependent methyltransferase [Bryobacteraceae bacterium]